MVVARAVLPVVALLATSGCGDADARGTLDAAGVGRMAERELVAENPRMAPGEMSCPALDLEVGESVRCVRTTELSGGRVVEVHGTVEVTSVEAGGRLHVAMDADAARFGRSGDAVATEVRRRYAERWATDPEDVECPYLPGEVGARVTCTCRVGDAGKEVDVVVTKVVEETFDTTYRVGRPRDAS